MYDPYALPTTHHMVPSFRHLCFIIEFGIAHSFLRKMKPKSTTQPTKLKKRGFIMSLAALNYDLPTIQREGKKLGWKLSYNTVKLWRDKHLNGEGLSDAPRQGRPKVPMPLSLKSQASKVGFSARKWAKKRCMARETTRRAIKQLGLKAFVRPKKPLLTKLNYQQRRRFLRQWGNLDLTRAFFIDSKYFYLFHCGCKYQWAEKQTDVEPLHSPKYSQSLHVYGGISMAGKTPLLFWDNGEMVTSKVFVNKIGPTLLKGIQNLNTDLIWVQDNAPAHKAKETQQWLECNVADFIPASQWPGNSPDFNPIEDIWGIIQQQVDEQQPQTIQTLKKMISCAWNKIPQQEVDKCILNFKNRVKNARAKNGGM